MCLLITYLGLDTISELGWVFEYLMIQPGPGGGGGGLSAAFKHHQPELVIALLLPESDEANI